MHRLTARLLLLFALVGKLAPLTLAVTAPPHACCVRKAAHHCHDSTAPESDQLVIRTAPCCNSNCGRAVITVRWASPPPPANGFCALKLEHHFSPRDLIFPNTNNSRTQSTRAPPYLSLS
ncbi:MAG: hypothetical protein ACYDDS_11430 [Candidatus Sulfotelmatobacter sp.]